MLNRKSSNFTHTKVRRRGTILVLTMTICFALAAVVLILARKMSVEAVAASNQVAAIQADAVERAGEQYVMALLNSAIATNTNAYSILDFNTYTEDYFAAIPVGADFERPTGWFWIVRPQYDEEDLPLFGLVDECSKIDLNGFGYPNTANTPAETTPPPAAAYTDGMLMLPGMTEDVAASIYDWIDPDTDTPTNSMGMEDQYYLSLDPPYAAKNRRFSNVEELMMVYGITPKYVFGDGTAAPLGELAGTIGSGQNTPEDPQLSRGVYDLLTTHGIATAGAFTVQGLINVNTAPRPVLQAFVYSLNKQDPSIADQIIAYRQQNAINPGDGDATWFTAAASAAGLTGNFATRITGSSLRYSADIVAVSANGRGYKRVRLIVDTANADGITTLVSAVSRRDLSDKGWPFDPAVLQYIRENKGQQLPAGFGVGGFVSSGLVTTSGGTQR